MKRTLAARYLFPVDGPPIENGEVVIEDGRILSVGRRSGAPAEDFGDAAILPGLVNAHTHLEFSHLTAPLGAPGMPFTDWIRLVVKQRQEADSEESEEHKRSAVRRGLAESLASGVATLGEIATTPWPASPFVESPVNGVLFQELLAFSLARATPLRELAESHARRHDLNSWRPGLSPHAPYSVHPQLLQAAVESAVKYNRPLAMHLAETAEELEFLRSLSGPFRTLLEDFGAWEQDVYPPNQSPLHILQMLSQAPRVLVIHGNYLSDGEIDFLSQHRENMSVVYCPRTCAYFQHPPHPLEKLLKGAVPVALGTDSRASNPDLCLLAEMAAVLERHAGVAPQTVLEMATLRGARALGMEATCGSLSPGKQARLLVLRLEGKGDPHSLLARACQQGSAGILAVIV